MTKELIDLLESRRIEEGMTAGDLDAEIKSSQAWGKIRGERRELIFEEAVKLCKLLGVKLKVWVPGREIEV